MCAAAPSAAEMPKKNRCGTVDKVVESSKKVDQKTVPGASNFHGQGPELTPPPYASWPPTPWCAECVGECCECGEPQGLLFTPGPGCFIFNILPMAPLRLEALQATCTVNRLHSGNAPRGENHVQNYHLVFCQHPERDFTKVRGL